MTVVGVDDSSVSLSSTILSMSVRILCHYDVGPLNEFWHTAKPNCSVIAPTVDILVNDFTRPYDTGMRQIMIVIRKAAATAHFNILRVLTLVRLIVGREAHPPRTLFGVALVFLGF